LSFEKGKYCRIIGPLIGFRLEGDSEMIPAINPLKVTLITNLMDLMSMRMYHILNFKQDNLAEQIFSVNGAFKSINNNVHANNNSINMNNTSMMHNNVQDQRHVRKSNNNAERFKEILKNIVGTNGSMRIDEMKFKLKRQHNLSDIEIDNVIEMCHNGGEDWYVNDDTVYSLFG